MVRIITFVLTLFFHVLGSANETGRMVLPDTLNFKMRDVELTYDLVLGGDRRGYDQLEIISERASPEIRIEALFKLARLEINGIHFEKNYTEALNKIINAVNTQRDSKSRTSLLRKHLDTWLLTPLNIKEPQEVAYIWLAYLRHENRKNKVFPHTGAPSAQTLDSLPISNTDTKNYSPAYPTLPSVPVDDKYIPLRGIWSLAKAGFSQAQYEIAMYLTENPTKSTITKEDTISSINLLWGAAFGGHKAAADELLLIYRKTGYEQDLITACSLHNAFRRVARAQQRRRIRFTHPMPECGSLEQPGPTDYLLEKSIQTSIESSGIYYPTGGPIGHGTSIWEYEY